MFALEVHRAECEFLTGALAAAEARLTMLSSRAATTIEQATVACLRLDLYTTLDRSDRAIDVGLTYLRHLGVEWSPHPTEEEARREYERTWALLGSRAIEELIDLPVMSDPVSLATLDVLKNVVAPALYTDANLCCLAISRMVNLSLEHGNTDVSCAAYVELGGLIAGPRFGDYEAGFRFGRLGYDLVEHRGLQRFKDRIYMLFGHLIMPWTHHVRAGRDLVRRAVEVAHAIGDLKLAANYSTNVITNLLAAGDPLVDVQREAEEGLQLAEQARFGLVIDRFAVQLGLIRTLRGVTPLFGCFNDERFDERRVERRLASNPRLALPACWYWIRKLQARFFAGDYVAAVEASVAAHRLLWTSPSFFETAEAHFYGALSHAAACDAALPAHYRQHVQALTAHHRQLVAWAEHGPENFANRAALVGAEIARLEGRELEAERLYEQAIRLAREQGFVQNEGLAYELAARFYAAHGFEEFARLYLRNARHCYLRWGADGKVRHLEALYPHLRQEAPAPDARGTIWAPIAHLDLATVLKVSHAVSGELVLDKLIDTLLRTAIEHAGAERGLLVLPRRGDLWIHAEAHTSGSAVVVRLRETPVSAAALPESVVRYAARTHENVLLDDATARHPFATDAYLQEQHARSVLCLPMVRQGALAGLLYLENTLTAHAFSPERIAVLAVLAAQAAIALENTRLYRELQEREARIRRLVDANIIGITLWDRQSRTLEANDAFLALVGYSREELASGQMPWPELTPAEWRGVDEQRFAELRATGRSAPVEKEYERKDGRRVPVLVGSATFEGQQDAGVSFVLDLTERKRAEEAVRQTQAELAHAARLTTLGELTASIAHEINQPLGAVVTNGQACLRLLARESPDLPKSRDVVERMIRSGMRASEVITRIRALLQKRDAEKALLNVNEIIHEVTALTSTELSKSAIHVQTALAPDLPPVLGDRVQLQQVILNLILNAKEAMSGAGWQPRELCITSLASVSGEAVVAVRDSGTGLDPRDCDRIFDAFFTTKADGLGLGLSISRSIIEAHSGRLWAAPNEDQGATIQFALPASGRTG